MALQKLADFLSARPSVAVWCDGCVPVTNHVMNLLSRTGDWSVSVKQWWGREKWYRVVCKSGGNTFTDHTHTQTRAHTHTLQEMHALGHVTLLFEFPQFAQRTCFGFKHSGRWGMWGDANHALGSLWLCNVFRVFLLCFPYCLTPHHKPKPLSSHSHSWSSHTTSLTLTLDLISCPRDLTLAIALVSL